jgi:molybdopterin converting factor small subunit
MVHVKVRIFYQAMPDHGVLELDEGSSVETLLMRVRERAQMERSDTRNVILAFLDNTGSLIVLLNGMSIYSLSGWKTVLHEGDEVSFLPMVAGG